MVGELKKPERNLPMAIILSLIVVIIAYLLTNIAYFAVLPLDILRNDQIVVGAHIGTQVFGFAGAIAVPVLVVLSTIGSTNASLFGTSRLIAATAEEGILYPRMFSVYNSKTHTPIYALLLTAILSCAYLIPPSSEFDILMYVCGFTVWVFFLITVLGMLYLRHVEPELHRPFKVNIIIPILFLLIAVFLLIAPFARVSKMSEAIPYIAATGIMVMPLPLVYVRLNGLKGRFKVKE
jgi:amino acid transporter